MIEEAAHALLTRAADLLTIKAAHHFNDSSYREQYDNVLRLMGDFEALVRRNVGKVDQLATSDLWRSRNDLDRMKELKSMEKRRDYYNSALRGVRSDIEAIAR